MTAEQKNSALTSKTWHEQHRTRLSTGARIADKVASNIGSWRFIIYQTGLVIIWMILNLIAWRGHWDPYPFILLNLLFSTQAAYAAPIIMMAQNRQNERDRFQAAADFRTNVEAKKEIENLQIAISRIENEQLSKILNELKSIKEKIVLK